MSLNQVQLTRLQNRIDTFDHILYEDTFLTRDISDKFKERQSVISILKETGAIESVDKKMLDSGKPVNVWAWKNHQQELQEYYENRSELPCGCREHIPAKTDEQGNYICKFCGSKHPREIIEQVL